jgi:hypothetical protein
MPFDLKIGAFPDPDQLIIRNANIHIHHAVTFPAGEVVMVFLSAGPVGMASIRKFDPVQQTHIDQHLNRPENSRSPQARIEPLQIMPEILHAEILLAGSQFCQPGGDPLSGLGLPSSLFFEGRLDSFC